ncbi:MAG TPA: bifunctional 4-hydroxy-2-oxoglutarate aldolase/2-dehydro-3-deoxy-phosphogluconate aldolase [Bacteroidales bacterium]|nr:bifunctional 4-hydroxy-2-oxoglutarate aldolase/2-dehydro-3-deoxy-phosphogluconate aldolase [Bacteroidales bacterium]HPT11610.1 bifunctional 4-hydroxy-2-oxoglutarate aldolase/2-dehydro-3-deoxy-phosphogluconate aldolase [Bacteroidales bacterium]
MAQFTRIEVALKMAEIGMVPVFYHKESEVCKEVIRACYEGGVRVFEFTNRGDYAHELFSDLNKWAAVECPHMIMGVGSVPDPATAAIFIQCGANFVVSPSLNPETAKVCNRRKILWIPGCGSLTEIGYAEELGAEIVKIFPAPSVGGPGFVKAVKGPCPWTSIMPTGGVDATEENLKQWFTAGVTAVGMGSNLITTELIANHDWKTLTENIAAALHIIKKYKK